MEPDYQHQVLAKLTTELADVASQVNLEAVGNDQELLSFLMATRDDGSGIIYFELGFMTYGEQSLFQIFTTILPRTQGKEEIVRQALNSWNLQALVGAYGHYPELDQVYHKYRMILDPAASAGQTADGVLRALYIIYDEVCARLPVLRALVQGTLTLEQAGQQNLL